MPTPLLEIQPQSEGYQFAPANEMISVKLQGGRSRVREDQIHGAQYVTATWILNKAAEYNYLMSFFREATFNGTAPFRVPLLSDAGVVVPHLCLCPEGIPRLTRQSGDAYWVQGTLEVTPNPIRQFGLRLENSSVPQVIDNGLSVFGGDIAEFEVGRDILLTSTDGIVLSDSLAINLDGTYEIQSQANTFTLNLLNAATVNPQWTALAGTIAQFYIPGAGLGGAEKRGAMILLPE